MTKRLPLIFRQLEAKWNNVQKEKLKKRMEIKEGSAGKILCEETMYCKNVRHGVDHAQLLIADELCHILTQKPDQERFIVRTDITFFAHSHKAEKIARPCIFHLH